MIMNQKKVLDPYRTLGCFVHGPVALSESTPYSFAIASYNSFKVYSHELAIKVVSPCFLKPITAIATYNEYTYVRTGESLIKMRYHHIVDEWKVALSKAKLQKGNKSSMLRFDEIIIVGQGNSVGIVDQQLGRVQKMELQHSISKVIHPISYVNKVIAYGDKNMTLLNVMSGTILYEFPNLCAYLAEQGETICLIQPTRTIHLIAIGTSSGKVLIYNLKSDKIVYTMKQKTPITALAFSTDLPLMISGDSTGKVLLWDYENGKIVYRLEEALSKKIDSIYFVPGYPLVVCTSSQSNQIRQFRINKDDNKILTMFRQRCGINEQIEKLKVHNDKQITFGSCKNMVFSSLYSHCNNYTLKDELDSKLPFHICRHNYQLNIYKHQSIIGTINIHEQAQNAKISLSYKYAIISTKSKIMKISMPSAQKNKGNNCRVMVQWNIGNVQQLHLYHQHYIYAICHSSVYVCDFNTNTIIDVINEGKNCYSACVNLFGNLLSLQNRTDNTLEIWNMEKREKGRIFKLQQQQSYVNCMAFTSDNKYLLSAHKYANSLLVWNIVDNELYKKFNINTQLQCMAFTPDNSYFLSVFRGGKEVNIWHNYIGKITTHRNQENLHDFHTQINKMENNYRKTLTEGVKGKDQEFEQMQGDEQFMRMLDEVDDASDAVWKYSFHNINKWMPLVYYDQIKARNTIQSQQKKTTSLPFFLDFNNIDEQKKKILGDIQAQIEEKKKEKEEVRDKLIKDDSHQIKLNRQSTTKEHQETFRMLSDLNIAQVDYQLRKFIINPQNGEFLGRMFSQLGNMQIGNRQVYNIMLIRFMDLLGSQICSPTMKPIISQLSQVVNRQAQKQGQIINKCLAIVQNRE